MDLDLRNTYTHALESTVKNDSQVLYEAGIPERKYKAKQVDNTLFTRFGAVSSL